MVAACGLLASGWYAVLLLARDSGLATPAYDEGFFQQLVWNLSRGRGFVSSFVPGSFLGLHFEPLLLVPAGLELAWPDPRLLSLLAALSIGALAPAAFLFLRSLTGRSGLSAALAAPLPFWPALQEAARAGFHPEYLGLGLALLAGWAALGRRSVLAWALALLALGGKEDQAWNLIVVGLAIAGVPAARRLGIQLASAGLCWGTVVVAVVMPAIRAGRPEDTDSYYAWLPDAAPGAVVQALSAPRGWLAVAVLLACAGGLPLRRPAWLALALPPLLADLLSAHDPQPLLKLQYAVPLVAPVLVAAAKAFPDLANRRPPALVALPAALLALALGGMPPAAAAGWAPFQRPAAVSRLQACTRAIPVNATVAADDPLLLFVASRPSLRELTDSREGDYLVIDRQAFLPGYVLRADRDRVATLSRGEVVCDDGRFLVTKQ